MHSQHKLHLHFLDAWETYIEHICRYMVWLKLGTTLSLDMSSDSGCLLWAVVWKCNFLPCTQFAQSFVYIKRKKNILCYYLLQNWISEYRISYKTLKFNVFVCVFFHIFNNCRVISHHRFWYRYMVKSLWRINHTDFDDFSHSRD